jgi:dienelactone hydrolase
VIQRRFISMNVLVFLLAAAASRIDADGDPGRVFDGAPPDARLEKAVTLDGYHPWEPVADLAAWKKRAERTRRQILVACGLWPMPEKTPLHPVIHGKIERDAYTIEKVFFESWPGFFVTGNLYRPKGGAGKQPAVLSPHGHWQNGRLYERPEAEAKQQIEAGKEKHLAGARYPLQARCATLARLGCVVFHYDMVGYADSKQLPHAAGFGDLEAELRLQSAFGVQTWNTIRAFDFLSALPDVDAARIGVTGASGGGTQTFILCAIDERPAAAFPAVMVSTEMQGGCICENASHLRVGTSNIEFAALAAPRPYGMTGADDWTKDILEKGLPELKAMWRAYGKEELVQAWHYPKFEHNYNQVSRERMYEWFNKHLGLGRKEPIEEPPFEPVPPEELRVFDAAHALPAHAVDVAGLRKRLGESSDAQMAALAPKDAATLAEFRRVVGGALEAMLHTSLPAAGEVEAKARGEGELAGVKVEKLSLARKGSGEAVPALFFKPAAWNGTVLVAVNHHGKSAACFTPSTPPHGDVHRMVKSFLDLGAAVLSPDLFLTGEYAPPELLRNFHQRGADNPAFKKDDGRHAKYVAYTYGYNRTVLAQRVHDLLTAIGHARALPGVKKVNLLGAREAAPWCVMARALSGDAVSRLTVVYGEAVDYSKLKGLDDPNFVPGALKYGGMAAFTALCAPGELRILSPSDPGELVRGAYGAAGKAESLRHGAPQGGPEGERELIEWLAR